MEKWKLIALVYYIVLYWHVNIVYTKFNINICFLCSFFVCTFVVNFFYSILENNNYGICGLPYTIQMSSIILFQLHALYKSHTSQSGIFLSFSMRQNQCDFLTLFSRIVFINIKWIWRSALHNTTYRYIYIWEVPPNIVYMEYNKTNVDFVYRTTTW